MPTPSNTYPKRGEVWIADLAPGRGWEVAKRRPVIIISANEINKISTLVVIIPLSSIIPSVIGPERVFIEKGMFLNKASIALPTQIRAIDKSRISKKVGNLSKDKLSEVEEALKVVLGL
ncbi:hypothetical protein A3A48_02130 [Candidatus Curtissbacteria bacterium RIFCSPLOWO2_01_FULL_37_9]|uniref:mRNA interferase n=1 Tax=Candidatus Curtissbacteria bacterium RIFCSPLOWO2_01_FULL_37_9 TaxID=1797724 RepID=A0A1F5GPL2_9BACT|nr:MAG: hypothetical protein A3A48_02130 [Candidatus Curtissbacteria bacterium RIFCSPLOWO2_01_FULL_37_9]